VTRPLYLFALLAFAYGCAEPPGIRSIDVGPLPPHDGSGLDGGRCVEEPIEAACQYLWYGSTCEVSCDLPDTCTFALHLTWSACVPPEYGDDWVDCVCSHGLAQCRNSSAAGLQPRTTPVSYCEIIPHFDADVSRDSGLDGDG
jgi:hypothetical protein